MTVKHTAVRDIKTPFSNTGSSGKHAQIAARVHWFMGTFIIPVGKTLNTLIETMADVWGDQWAIKAGERSFHGRPYDHAATSGHGIKLCWTEPELDGTGRAWLSIPGGVLDRVTLREFHRVATMLYKEYKIKCTRWDAAIDDYSKRIMPMEILKVAYDGGMVGPKKYRVYATGERGHLAMTFYAGMATSDKIVRVYDKEEESDGEIPAVRWELQARDEIAHTAFLEWLVAGSDETSQEIEHVLARQVTGAVDWRDPATGRRPSEQTRFSWYQSLIEDASGRMRITVERMTTTLEQKWNWLKRQAAGTLAMLYEAGPGMYSQAMKRLRVAGRNRANQEHSSIIGAFLGTPEAHRVLWWRDVLATA